MYALTTTIFGGIVATLMMIGVMELITRSKLANADMVRAIGSIFTKSYKNALNPGLFIHIASGVFFAFIYFSMFSFVLGNNTALGSVAGLAGGFFHGIVITLALVNLVAKYHPLQKFQQTGFYMAFAHVVGHMVYGLSLGVIYSVAAANIV